METLRYFCRFCLSDSDFNVSLFSNFCRKINMLEKIFACLNITIKETDYPNTICYKCVVKIEGYYDFITCVKKCHEIIESKKSNDKRSVRSQLKNVPIPIDVNNIVEMDLKISSSLFSCFSSEFVLNRTNDTVLKSLRVMCREALNENVTKKRKKGRRQSKDMFESLSQDDVTSLK